MTEPDINCSFEPFKWWETNLAENIMKGNKQALIDFTSGLEKDLDLINLVEAIHPSVRRISRIRKRPIASEENIQDVIFDLDSYFKSNTSSDIVRQTIASIMALETSYYPYARKVARHLGYIFNFDDDIIAEAAIKEISWAVWGAWDTTFGECFTGLHKLIIFQLAHRERWKHDLARRQGLEVSYQEVPDNLKIDLPEFDVIRDKPNIRLSNAVLHLPLPGIISTVERLPWFEQLCAYIALNYVPESPNLYSYAKFWGIKRESASAAIDRVIDNMPQRYSGQTPKREVWELVNTARIRSLLYYPSGKRVEFDSPRVPLLQAYEPSNLTPLEKRVWDLAVQTNGKYLVFSGEQIADKVGMSPVWVARRINEFVRETSLQKNYS